MSMKDKKASKPDGIPSEVLKLVCKYKPNLLLGAFNACLTTGVYRSRWQVAKLVLISKGKGDPEAPSEYRPLSILDTAGKLLEKLIKPRLIDPIRAAGDYSPTQYGFKAERSTIDAIEEMVRALKLATVATVGE